MKFKNLIETRRKYYSYLLWIGNYLPSCTWIHLCVIPLSPSFCSRVSLNTYVNYTWKTTHLVKLQHLDLFRNLGLIPTVRWVEQNLLQTSQVVQGLVAWHYHFLSFNLTINLLVQRFSMPRTSPWTPFLKPSFIDTYATHESIKPSPTLIFVTHAVMGPPHGGLDLGPN